MKSTSQTYDSFSPTTALARELAPPRTESNTPCAELIVDLAVREEFRPGRRHLDRFRHVQRAIHHDQVILGLVPALLHICSSWAARNRS